ncbi:MAG: DUF819 family protein [Spirochaetales bacterium]|nr:DUF819 family protein [Spirochaetales bacterium]
MAIVQGLAVLVFLTFFPWLSIVLSRKSRVLDAIGPVVLCYAGGALLVNLAGLHFQTDKPADLADTILKELTGISVVLAIPLLLFGTHFLKWLRIAPQAVKSFALVILSVTVIGFLSVLMFRNSYADRAEASIVAGMLMGVYTGGTPNLSSIGRALGAPAELFALINAADVICGGIYLLFLFTLAKPLLSRFLKPFEPANRDDLDHEEFKAAAFWKDLQPGRMLLVIAAALLCVGLGFGLATLFPRINEKGEAVPSETILFLSLTTFAIAFSFVERIRETRGIFDLGNYLILIFCTAIGMSISLPQLLSAGGTVFLNLAFMMTGSVVLHFFLCWIFKIDVDTAIITNAAGIYGAPFIVPVADAIKNRAVIVSGITTSLAGYALGNYLGISLGNLFLNLP